MGGGPLDVCVEDGVHQTEVAVQQVSPHDTDDSDAEHVGSEKHCPEERPPRELHAQQDCEPQRKAYKERHTRHREDTGVRHASPELLVLHRLWVKQVRIVLQPHPRTRREGEVPVMQTDPDAVHCRNGDEDREHDEVGSEED